MCRGNNPPRQPPPPPPYPPPPTATNTSPPTQLTTTTADPAEISLTEADADFGMDTDTPAVRQDPERCAEVTALSPDVNASDPRSELQALPPSVPNDDQEMCEQDAETLPGSSREGANTSSTTEQECERPRAKQPRLHKSPIKKLTMLMAPCGGGKGGSR